MASLNTSNYQHTVSILLSNDDDNDNNNNNENGTHTSQPIQLTTAQRLAVFVAPTHTYLISTYSYASELLHGTPLSDEQYFQHCKELIWDGRRRNFGILRILNMVNPSTIDLLIQSLKTIDPYNYPSGEPFKYILHINSKQWKDIGQERRQELLDTLEEVKGRHPLIKQWHLSSDYDLMKQALIKLSMAGITPVGSEDNNTNNSRSNNEQKG